MKPANPIEISLSKKKLVLALLGAFAFIVIGLWLIIFPPQIDHPLIGNPVFIFLVGLACVLFFGWVAVVVIKKLPEREPGLIIHDEGIVDNSSGAAVGLILWSDMEEIKQLNIMGQKILMIRVKNPEEYIQRHTGVKRKALQMNQASYGSPVHISANALATNFSQLHQLIQSRFEESKRKG